MVPVSEPSPSRSPAITPASAAEGEGEGQGEGAVGAGGGAPGTAVATTDACRMTPRTAWKTKAVPPVDDSGGGSAAAAAAVQPNERVAADNAKDDRAPGLADEPLAVPSRSQPEVAAPGGINPQVEDSNTAAAKPEVSPAAAAGASTATGESVAGRSPQSSKVSATTPPPAHQDTIPAGLLWSDFGGGREAGEDAEETASREFAEESFGILHGVRLDSDSVARSQVTVFVGT